MDSKNHLKSIRLQTRLILYSTLLILFLMVLTILLVEKRQSEIIVEEARKRGMAIARNLAAVSTNALLTYNYVVLQQNGEKVAQEEDIVYVIIHDKENRVALYSGHDEKQGVVLEDEISPVPPGRAQEAAPFLIRRGIHQRMIIGQDRFRQVGRQALVGCDHITQRRAVINHVVPG